MNKKNLTPYEKDILKAFEKGEYTVVDQLKKKKEQYQAYAQATATKNKSISLRVSEKDLGQLKVKALEVGMPYQTLLNVLIRQFNAGKIEVSI